MLLHALVAALLLLALPQPTPPAPPAPPAAPPEPPFPIAIPRAALKTNAQSAYLGIILDLRAREAEALADPSLESLYLDVLPWYLVAVGEHRAAAEIEPKLRELFRYPRPQHTETPPFPADARPAPAASAVLGLAKGRRVVMLNEEHRSSVQRAFLNELIDGLAAEGFTHLALEALNSDAAADANRRGHLVLSSGTYTLDPALADAARRARARGLTLVSYDYDHPALPQLTPEQMDDHLLRENNRELHAARHLRDILDADPKARLIVFAGRGHIHKAPAGKWVPMSARLKEATGVDPLCIDLTHQVEFADRAYETNAYHHATKLGLVTDAPVILLAADGAPWSHAPAGLDASVFFPRTRWEHARPRFLRMGGLRTPARITIDRGKIPGPALLQAHIPGESPDAVPVDQVILWPDHPTPPLLLRPGRYTIQLIDREGARLHEQALTIE